MSLVAFILGAGANVGRGVAKRFAEKGYTVVAGSRSGKSIEGATHSVKVDITQPTSIAAAFVEVEKVAGAPSVVVFNAAGFTPAVGDVVSTISSETFSQDVAYGTNGLYASIQGAVAAFRRVPASAPKAFIYTGNILPFVPADKPLFLTLGASKVAAAYQIQLFSHAYRADGFRFYFASQISRSGGPVSAADLSGDAHATAYWNLVQRTEQGEWDLRFYEDGSEGPHYPVHL